MGIVYKILANKHRMQTVLATLAVRGSFTPSGRETGEVLLNELLPLDSEEDDLPPHGKTRIFLEEFNLS